MVQFKNAKIMRTKVYLIIICLHQKMVSSCGMTQSGTNKNSSSIVAINKSAIKIIAVIGLVIVVAVITVAILLASVNNPASVSEGGLSGRYVTDSGGYIEFTERHNFMAGHPALSSELSNGTYVLDGNLLLLTYTSADFLGVGIHGTVSEDRLEIMMHHTLFVKE
jgi:hypothetical protein